MLLFGSAEGEMGHDSSPKGAGESSMNGEAPDVAGNASLSGKQSLSFLPSELDHMFSNPDGRQDNQACIILNDFMCRQIPIPMEKCVSWSVSTLLIVIYL
jgi:hypothetical protein